MFLKMELDIMDSGKASVDTDKEHKYGQTELSMKASGKIIKLMAAEPSGTYTEISTRVNGKETERMVPVSIPIATEQLMRATGNTISNTAKV